MSSFKHSGAPALQRSSTMVYPMEKGINPVIAEGLMKHGNKNDALLELIKHVDRSRPPRSDDKFTQLVIMNMLQRRLGYVDNEMTLGSAYNKAKWDIVTKFSIEQNRHDNSMPEIDFPTPAAVYLDDEVTPMYVERHNAEIIPHADWMMTWVLCLEAFLFGVVTNDGDYGQFIELDGFLYHNAVASNNTMIKLRKMMNEREI
ncbi:MAG: hypothetical protein E4H07_09575 [Nitrosomonadales bacterium]|nr:MAG: hypothetical protein E4H07_09575 [Nitrosomonadales bacterium]